MLETRIAHYQTTWESCYPTPALYKDTYPFLREVDGFALCNAQLALEKAYKRFFEDRKTGFPKYKSKRRGRKTYTTNLSHGNIRLDDKARRLKLPKLGWLAVRQHKRIPYDWKLKSVTVEHCPSGRYTATILFEYETQIPEKVKPVKPVGLDYASHGLYVSSDGEHAEYPGYYRKMQDKLAREQCKLSHMVKGSANWRKQCKRVGRLYEKTANQRRDYQHKKANSVVASYDMVGVEILSMKSMMKKPKPKPDPEHPGHYLPNGRKARKGLAKSTSDNGYGMFCTMLEYKLARQGKQLVHVGKWYPSSQLCHDCGCKNPLVKDLSIREWACPSCGVLHDRDVNAARNIRDEAMRIIE
jgi:putative transposase